MLFFFDKGPYRHRRDWPDASTRLAHIHSRIDELLELERKTAPASGDKGTDDKDFAAFVALRTVGDLVDELVGWAIDHHNGLTLSGLKVFPRLPPDTRDHRDRATADSHEHEAQGSDYFDPNVPTEREDRTERRMLANLLRMNPGGFPPNIFTRAVEALEALEFGEVQEMLRPATTALRKNAYTRYQLELRAIEHVEYMVARGTKKLAAQAEVGEA